MFDCFAGSDDRTVQLPSNLPDLTPLLLTTAAIFALRSDELLITGIDQQSTLFLLLS